MGEVTKIPAMLWSGRANDRGVISAKLEGRDFLRLLLQFLQPSHPNVGKWASRNERSLRYASVYNAHHNSPLYQLLRPRLANVAMRSIEHEQWHLVWSGLGDTYELYDLENDPGELDNLADRRPVIVERLARMLESAGHRLGRRVTGTSIRKSSGAAALAWLCALDSIRAAVERSDLALR